MVPSPATHSYSLSLFVRDTAVCCWELERFREYLLYLTRTIMLIGNVVNAMDENPKNPNESVPTIPPNQRGTISYVLSFSPEMYLDPEVWEGELYAVSARF